MTDYLRLAQERAATAQVPRDPVDEQNPYLEVAQGLAGRQEDRARFVIDQALKYNPDTAAEIQRLRSSTGLPADVVERNLEEVRRREAAAAIDYIKIAQDSPILARQLTDPNFTTVAIDDIGVLSDIGRILRDTGVSALKGAVGLPQAAVGIADIPSMGQVGKALESIGYRPNEAQDILSGFYSESTQRALARVQNADGFLASLSTALRNPVSIYTTVLESLPQVIGGAALARGLLAVGGNFGPVVAGSVGEGLMAAGAAAEGMRGESEDGLLTAREALSSLGLGAGTSLLGYAGGRIAKGLGLGDVDTALAQGDLTGTPAPGFAKQVLGQGISEGLFEELPQSVQEQMWQNFAAEKPLFDGVGNAAAMGLLAGGVTGAGFGAIQATAAKVVGAAAQQADAIERATLDSERLSNALDAATQSALRERSPEQFRQLLAQMAPDEQVYVDGEVLAQLPTEVLNQLPATVVEQVAQAAAIGDVVGIPVADALTVAPGTELEQALVDHGRKTPDAMSAVEARQAGEQAEEFLKQEAERVIAQAQDQEALRASAEVVRTSIVDQLNAAGRYRPQINEAMSQWASAFYTAYGSRLGMTPEEFYQRYPLRVLGAPVGQQTGVLNAPGAMPLRTINVGDTVDGRVVRDGVPNLESIASSLDNYEVLPGVREVPMSAFDPEYVGGISMERLDERTRALVDEIRASNEITPLIVVQDADGMYVLEGGHRFDALIASGAQSLPAVVVIDQDNPPGVLNQAAVERLQMVAERGVRATASRSVISAEERAAIQASAAEINMSVAELETIVRNHKLAHPVAQGWEPLVYVRSVLKDGKALHQYQKSPYTFSTGADGKTIEPGTANYTRRVNAVARSMIDEVRTVFRRATNGDRNAQNILAQAGWYKAMRSRLRREFGGLGDLFADLLGATSPNTPVRDNWFNAVDALRRASRGDFDGLILQWETWADNLDALETDLRAWFNDRLAEGLSKKAIKDLPEYQTKLRAVRAAREIPENLLPTKESGAKYGFNGKNVIRAMVDLWRIVKNADPDIARGGTAPKALNFSGNLIGFRSRATIDVWAARMLQRLAGGRRIASMAETGVSGDMREDATTTLQFGFGQDVFSNAARAIRNDPELQADAVLAEINDDDLQAVVWFVEKEIWTVNNWTSAAGEGGSFELEANLTGTSQQDRVKELRTIIDASPPTADVTAASQDTTAALTAIEEHERKYADEIEELRKLTTGEIAPYKGSKKRMTDLGKLVRPPAEATRLLGSVDRAKGRLEAFNARKVAAKAELAALEREVDRFVGGLSIQMSQETQGIDFVPTDADMARLAEDIRLSVYETDDGNTVLASKALSTEGRYGGVERSLDLEVVAREGYNANALWLQMLRQAQGARQDSTFLSRVLRANEQYDPLTHRPGVEIYLRSAASQSQLEKVLGDLAKEGVEFLTVIVDGRRLANTMAGQMPAAVGVRLQYVPEFEQRYGMDDLSGLDDVALAARIEEKAAELRAIADRVSDAVEGVSFAGQFWYETQVAFSSQYEEKINALTAGVTEEGAAGALGRQQWAGDSVRSGLEGADRQSRETAGGEPGGDVLGGDAQRPGVLEQQPLAQGPRGTFNPQTLELVLNPNADLSTFFHETGHFFLEVLADVASQPNAPAQIAEDYTKVLSWFGVTPEQWAGFSLDEKRPYHERWAESIEQYVMEGKVPSAELQPLMRRFRAWLISVYQSIKQFLAQRGVVQPGGETLGQGDRSRVGMNFRDVVKRTPELQAAAERVKAGEMTAAEYDALVNELKPVEPYASVPAPATGAEIRAALTSDKVERVGVASQTLEEGHPVGLRLDIPAYSNHGTWVVSVHEQEAGYNAGKSIGYEPVAAASNVTFGVVEKAAMNIASGKPKATIAVIKGAWKPTTAAEAKAAADQALTDPAWVQVGMDPERHSYFYDRATMEPVIAAEEVIQIGPLVLAKNPTYGDKKAFLFQGDQQQPLNIQLNDDIRRVMDRMVATDEQIAQANEVAGFMPDEQADGEAAERLQKRSMADLKWAVKARDKAIARIRREAREIEKKIRAEVVVEIDATREMQARAALSQLRKDKNYNDQTRATVADSFGYASVAQMDEAIKAFGKRSDAIDGRTEQRMLEEYGDLVDERAIQQAANEAVHNEARARSLATELRTQQEMINQQRTDTGRTNVRGARITVNTLVEAAKQFGANVVSRTVLKDLRIAAQRHVVAERKAGRRWQEATTKGDTQAAVQAKRDQVLNNAAAKALLEAQDEVKKIQAFFGRVMRDGNEKTVDKGRDPDIVNAARAVLAEYGYQTRNVKKAGEYLEVVKREDPETWAAIEPIIALATQAAQPLDSLSFEQLVGLHESIQSLWFLSKRSRQMEIDGDLMDIEDLADELYARMDEIGIPDRIPGEGMAVSKAEERGLFLKQGIAFLRRVEQWAEGMDGGYGGPFLRYVFQPIKNAADRYRAARLDYRKKFQALVDNLAPIVGDSVIDAPELRYRFGAPGSTAGTAMNEILHAIAHTGNDSNKRKLLLGRGWAKENPDGTLDTSRWDMFIQRLVDEGKLTKEHFDFVQGVWDLLEETKPLAQQAHRVAFGRFFDEITANSFVDPFGVERRGGYIPAQVDTRVVTDNSTRRLLEEQNQSMAYAFPQPDRGFTRGRVDYNRELLLDLRSLSQHIDKVLLFSYMTVPARNVRKLLTQRKVSQPLNRIQPAAYDSMLTPWLQRSSQQIVETPVIGSGRWARLPGILRARAGMALMFGNVSNAIQQITGLSAAAVRVKPSFLMRSMAQYVANPRQFSRAVWDASTYMDDRAKNEIAVLNEQMQAILIKPTEFERMQDWAMRHAYFLQTALDNVLSPIVWTGAFNQALEQGMSDKDAVRFADSTVRQTQGSVLPEDVSRIETGPAYARMFTQFVSYFNMMANTNGTALKQITNELGLRKGAGKALYVVAMGLMAPIWVAEAIAIAFRGGPDDEDDDGYLDDWVAQVFGMGTVKGLLAQVPILGQFGVAGINRFNDNPLDDRVSLSPAISFLESFVGTPQSVYDAIVEDGSAQKAIRDVATLVSVATGVPIYAVARPLGYAAGVAEGRIEPTGPVDVARGLITGTASPESKAQ